MGDFWSTKEKLAIASYVLRSGEQQWSGVGKLLEPLGESGRSAEWFSPQQCAEQYNKLLLKFGDTNNNNSNVETAIPEELVVSRLTDLRIKELNSQLLQENDECLVLEEQIKLLESGALDDKLDDLLNESQNLSDTKNEGGEISAFVERNELEFTDEDAEVEMIDSSIAEEVRLQIEKLREISPIKSVEASDRLEKSSPLILGEESLEIVKTLDVSTDEKVSNTNENIILDKTCKSGESSENIHCVDKNEQSPISTSQLVMVDQKDDTDVSAEVLKPDSILNEEHLSNEVIVKGYTSASDEPVGNNGTAVGDTSSWKCESCIDMNVIVATEKTRGSPNDVTVGDNAVVSSAIDDSYTELIEENESVCNEPIVDFDEELRADTKTAEISPNLNVTSEEYTPGGVTVPVESRDSDSDAEENANWKGWKKSIMILWKQIASHRYASLFVHPVTDDIAPNYSTTIYRTMDLTTIKKNIETGTIRTTSEFQRDLMLMFQNAIMYNSEGHDVYKMATEMQMDVMDQVAQFLATQIMVDTAPSKSGRRHSKVLPPSDHVFVTTDMLLSVLVSEARSKRVAAIEGEARFMRKKQPSHEN